jgi:hypothetical protein
VLWRLSIVDYRLVDDFRAFVTNASADVISGDPLFPLGTDLDETTGNLVDFPTRLFRIGLKKTERYEIRRRCSIYERPTSVLPQKGDSRSRHPLENNGKG